MRIVEISAKLKRIGNSIAFIIPAKVRKKMGLEENDEIMVQIREKKREMKLFGMLGKRRIVFEEGDRVNARE